MTHRFWISRKVVGEKVFRRFAEETATPGALAILRCRVYPTERTLTRFCQRLTDRNDGVFRVPDESLWCFAAASGAFECFTSEWIRFDAVPDGKGLENRSFWNGRMGLGTLSRATTFRLAWIPPEDER